MGDQDGLRVDTHCYPGAAIPPYYDSLLVKVTAHGLRFIDAARRIDGVSNRVFLDPLLRGLALKIPPGPGG